MRRILLLPLALSAAFTVGACRTGTDDTKQTAFQVPKRDLTLQQANAPQVEVASPLELARAEPTRPQSAPNQQTQRRPIRTRRHVTPAAPAPQAEPSAVDAVVTTPAAAAATPVSQAVYEAPDPHALAPGQTVTVLPASSSGGSTSNSGWTDRGPADAQRGEPRGPDIWTSGEGGNCGRHPGSGGRPAPAIDLR
jgi:hypothetical protein